MTQIGPLLVQSYVATPESIKGNLTALLANEILKMTA